MVNMGLKEEREVYNEKSQNKRTMHALGRFERFVWNKKKEVTRLMKEINKFKIKVLQLAQSST